MSINENPPGRLNFRGQNTDGDTLRCDIALLTEVDWLRRYGYFLTLLGRPYHGLGLQIRMKAAFAIKCFLGFDFSERFRREGTTGRTFQIERQFSLHACTS